MFYEDCSDIYGFSLILTSDSLEEEYEWDAGDGGVDDVVDAG